MIERNGEGATLSRYRNDLLWLCIRDQCSFIVKRPNEKTFSTEPFNLTNKHTAKYSGLANEKVIGLQPGKHGKGVTLITKAKTETETNPKKNVVKSTLRNSSAKVGPSIDFRGYGSIIDTI